MRPETQYNVIGIMSGTSLDGVDIAFCRFDLTDGRWVFRIVDAVTIPYPEEWFSRLSVVA